MRAGCLRSVSVYRVDCFLYDAIYRCGDFMKKTHFLARSH